MEQQTRNTAAAAVPAIYRRIRPTVPGATTTADGTHRTEQTIV